VEKLIASRPDVIFHLAAIVSGEAEADFEKGYASTSTARGACSRRSAKQRRSGGFLFSARRVCLVDRGLRRAVSRAIGDEFVNAPLTSYGTQKTICELLLSDYSRKGFFDASACACRHLRPAGEAQPRRVRVLLRHHPRAARRPGGGAAGAGDGASLVRLAARGDRLPRACGKARYRAARRAPQPQHAGISATSASKSKRCGALLARKWCT